MKIKILKKILAHRGEAADASVLPATAAQIFPDPEPPRTPSPKPKQPAKQASDFTTFLASPALRRIKPHQKPAATTPQSYLSLDQQNQILRARIDELHAERHALQTTQDQSRKSIADHAAALEARSQEITILQKAQEPKLAQIKQDSSASLATLQKKYTVDSQSQHLKFQAEQASLKEQIQNLEAQKEELTVLFTKNLDRAQAYFRTSTEQQKHESAQIQKQHTREIRELTTNHRRELSTLTDELEATRLVLSERDAELAQLSDTHTKALQQATHDLQTEHTRTVDNVQAETAEQVSELTSQRDTLAQQLDDAEKTLAEQDQKINHLTQQIEHLTAQLNKTAAELDATKATLVKSRATATRQDTEILALRAEVETLRATRQPDDLVLNTTQQKEIIGLMVILFSSLDPEIPDQNILNSLPITLQPLITLKEIASLTSAAAKQQAAEFE
jgi:chromosome segregation ATPase